MHPADWGVSSSDTLISSEALTRSSLTTSIASTPVSPSLLLWIKVVCWQVIHSIKSHKGHVDDFVPLRQRKWDTAQFVEWFRTAPAAESTGEHMTLSYSPGSVLHKNKTIWNLAKKCFRIFASRTSWFTIEMMENLMKKYKLEQCMNAEISDKAEKLRRGKSETAFKHSAHPNEQRGHAACYRSYTVARLTQNNLCTHFPDCI